jgi:hypothetical protein
MVYLKPDCYAILAFLSIFTVQPVLNSNHFKTQMLLQVIYHTINDSLIN